jgi:hypothetical protein
MSNAERQRRHRAKLRDPKLEAELAKLRKKIASLMKRKRR